MNLTLGGYVFVGAVGLYVLSLITCVIMREIGWHEMRRRMITAGIVPPTRPIMTFHGTRQLLVFTFDGKRTQEESLIAEYGSEYVKATRLLGYLAFGWFGLILLLPILQMLN